MVDFGFFFAKSEILLQTASEWYLVFKARITPWSNGWVCDTVLGGININSIPSRFFTCRCDVQSSIIKTIFLLAESNFRSSSVTQSSKSSADIQLLSWARYQESKRLTPLKPSWFFSFLNDKHVGFFFQAWSIISPVTDFDSPAIVLNDTPYLKKNQYTFFYISNLVAKAPGLNLCKKLSNLLRYREVLNQ